MLYIFIHKRKTEKNNNKVSNSLNDLSYNKHEIICQSFKTS